MDVDTTERKDCVVLAHSLDHGEGTLSKNREFTCVRQPGGKKVAVLERLFIRYEHGMMGACLAVYI